MFIVPDSLITVHKEPAWRSRGGYVFQNIYSENGVLRSEQCWGRQIEPGLPEVGCIPFVTNHFAMGDWIVESENEDVWIQTKSCGSSVLRFFPSSRKSKDVDKLLYAVRERGGLMELSAKNEILAIHCQTEQIESLVLSYAEEVLTAKKILKWEFGFRPDRKR